MIKCLFGLVVALVVPGWLTYTDATNKYSIDYPKEWTKSATQLGMAFLSPKDGPSDNFQENVNVIVQDLADQPMTLEQYSDFSKKQVIDNFGASAIISITPAKLAGEDAKIALYRMNYQGHSLKIKQYWIVKNKKAFVITYTAEPGQFARYEDTAMQAMTSFRFN